MVVLKNEAEGFESFLKNYYQSDSFSSRLEGKKLLFESINYSLFSGGKRFRPLLSLATAEIFDLPPEVVYPYAASIESIHTYSLIHDDLPCMDNDDLRRGKPTNHTVYKEDIALLAGDALISEAFAIIANHYWENSDKALQLVSLLASSIGPQGMVAGQALDLRSENSDLALMNEIHLLKTGQLIKASTLGVGVISGASEEEMAALENFSLNLGMAFQLADDLHDAEDGANTSEASMVNILGNDGVRKLLDEKSTQCYSSLEIFEGKSNNLQKLVEYNLNRKS